MYKNCSTSKCKRPISDESDKYDNKGEIDDFGGLEPLVLLGVLGRDGIENNESSNVLSANKIHIFYTIRYCGST